MVFDWVKIWQQVRVVCLVSVCVCMWEEDLDHPTITHWPACYKASRPHSTPWVKFTGLAIMGVNNPVLSVTVLPVLSSTQHPSLENRHRPPTPLIYHLYPIWGIMIFFLPLPPPLFPISSVSLSLSLTSGFTSVLSFFFFLFPAEAINAVALSHSPWTGGELLRSAASLSTLSRRSLGSPGGRLCANMQMSLCPCNDSVVRLHPLYMVERPPTTHRYKPALTPA